MGQASERSTGRTVVVVAGGDRIGPVVAAQVPGDAYVIAADSGIDLALDAGLAVDAAVGDFDSVTPAGLAQVEASGAIVDRHPADKDATDLDLALDRALALDPAALLLVGGGGGRLDHLFGNILCLTRPDLADVRPRALIGPAALTVVHGGQAAVLTGRVDELVSLLPVHGSAEGVTTEGLRWALSDAELAPGTAWGISNRFLDRQASVAVVRGVVVAVQPTANGPAVLAPLPGAASVDGAPVATGTVEGGTR